MAVEKINRSSSNGRRIEVSASHNQADDAWGHDGVCMKAPKLSSAHYAAARKYGDDAVPRPLDEINDLGRRYAETANEDVLLEICQAFHPYLMKYLVMIRSGHVAMYRGRINKDVEEFIKYFLPKGTPLSVLTASHSVRHLLLFFKKKTADEIYDVFMELL